MSAERSLEAGYEIKPLDGRTWDVLPPLAERHNGVWGGCWCTWFHTMNAEKTHTAEGNRSLKEQLVRRAGRTPPWSSTATWPSPGASTAPRPNCPTSTTARSTRRASSAARLPADLLLRRQEVPPQGRPRGVALQGALQPLIAQAGGGVVEAYPQDTAGQKISVLYNGTRSLYERAGFTYVRPKGKRNCVMRRVVR